MNDTKTNSFLDAIQKYADKQKQDMEKEIEDFKAEEMKKAEEEGLNAAYELIHKELEYKKSAVTCELARKEKESLDELYITRSKMTQTVFEKASEKLLEYTKSEEYAYKLIEYAEEIAECFGEKDCVIYLNERDMKHSNKLCACFKGNTRAEASADIRQGGIKVFCEEAGMIADETLDSRLEAQKQWFVENSALKVM